MYSFYVYVHIFFQFYKLAVILYYFFIQKRKSKQNKISKKNIDHD